MESSCVRQSLIPGTSAIFGDYLYHYEKVREFYPYWFGDTSALVEAAKAIDFPAERRAALVSALRQQNGDSDSLRKLAEPDTVAVVTGQQVGLFSGPSYTFFKALTAAKLAEHLNQQGIPAVPVFWLATEDHDLAEVDHAWLFDAALRPQKLTFTPGSEAGGPVGEVVIRDVPLAQLRTLLAEYPFGEEVFARLETAYQPGATLGQAFRSFLQPILQQFGLLYLDPLQPGIRALARTFLNNAAENILDVVPELQARDKALAKAGYHSQVNIESGSTMLFVIEGGKRTAVRSKDGRFITRDDTYTPAEFAQAGLELSPNALLRPVMQDYLLPTLAYVGGPAEIAYMAQAEVLYRRLLGRMPVLFPRNSFTLLDARASKLLQKYGLEMPNLLADHEQVRSRMAAKLVPRRLTEHVMQVRSQIEASLKSLQADLLAFDPTLQSAAVKSTAKMLYQVDKLSQKTARETFNRDERASYDASYLLNLIYPERHLQERFYSIVPFLAKTGLDLPGLLWEHTQLACPDHMVRAI